MPSGGSAGAVFRPDGPQLPAAPLPRPPPMPSPGPMMTGFGPVTAAPLQLLRVRGSGWRRRPGWLAPQQGVPPHRQVPQLPLAARHRSAHRPAHRPASRPAHRPASRRRPTPGHGLVHRPRSALRLHLAPRHPSVLRHPLALRPLSALRHRLPPPLPLARRSFRLRPLHRPRLRRCRDPHPA